MSIVKRKGLRGFLLWLILIDPFLYGLILFNNRFELILLHSESLLWELTYRITVMIKIFLWFGIILWRTEIENE